MFNCKKLYHFYITIVISYLMIVSFEFKFIVNSSLSYTNSGEILSNQLQPTIATVVDRMKYLFNEKNQYDDGLGAMNDIMIQDNLAYVAVQWGGLVIFNITDLTNPIMLGSYNEPQETITGTDLTSGIFIRRDIAFVADGTNGLLILNVSDPLNIKKIGQYKEESYWKQCFGISIENNYAYLRCGDYLIILDISNLSSPVKISEEEYFGFKGLEVKNSIILITNSISSIVVNASDPTNLVEIATLNNSRVCALKQDYLLTIMGQNRLGIFNLTTLPTLTMVANYSLMINGTLKYLSINDDFAFVGSTEEIVMVNITEPTNPQNVTKITDLNWFYDLDSIWIKRKLATTSDSSRRTILFFTDYQKGLLIHNFSKAKDERLIGYYNCGMKSELVATKGNYVYIVSMVENPYYPSQFEIFTFSDKSLERVGNYPINGSTWDLVIADGFALLAINNGIDVVNISNPANPTRISFYYYSSGPYPNWGVFYEPSQAIIYLCADSDGLVILDASDLRNITMISKVSNFFGYYYRARDVYVYNNVAFVADVEIFGGFGMIDVSDPWHPSIIDYIHLDDSINGIYVQNDLLYLTADAPALQIFNISDVNNPIQLSECLEKESATGQFFINNSLCFLAQWTKGLTIIDIQNPLAPKVITSISDSLTGFCKGVYVNGLNIFIADAWDGLEVWELIITQLLPIWRKTLLYTIFSSLSFIIFTILVIVIIKKRKNTDSLKES